MGARLWYPQLDVYDTARRMSVLLQFFKAPPGLERLAISDFYLSTPPLLHYISMSRGTRKIFNELKIPKPEKIFITLPAPQILFHKMEPIQKQALISLSGRGLVSNDDLREGRVLLTELGKLQFDVQSMTHPNEKNLCDFLTRTLFNVQDEGNRDLRAQTGLRRPS